jgi:hypothetical protein
LEIGSDNWQNSPSLDRIDNTKGYEKGNVIMVSHMANSIKNQATPSQIKKVADFYMKLYAEKGIKEKIRHSSRGYLSVYRSSGQGRGH